MTPSLLTLIKDRALAARKARETAKASFLTTLMAEAEKVGKDDGNRASTDAEVTATIKKFIKNTDESVKALAGADGSRAATRDQLVLELALLRAYLPQQASEAEVRAVIAETVNALSSVSPKQTGVVMAALQSKFEGNFDKGAASKWVKAALTSPAVA